MIGSGIMLTDRDRAILHDVAEFDLVSRPQLQRLRHFGSRTRANAVLARLVRFGYLAVRRQPLGGGSRRLIYHLGPTGYEFLHLEEQRHTRRSKRLSDLFLEHHLRITDVRLEFMALKDPEYIFDRWLTDATLREAHLGVVPDGFVEYRYAGLPFAAFVEIDLGTETLRRWEGKAAGYLQLAKSGAFRSVCNLRYFRVLVIAPTPGRVQTLTKALGRITHKVFWLTTLAEIVSQGPLARIWRRPDDSPALHSLTQPS